jgi:hypothetical protein
MAVQSKDVAVTPQVVLLEQVLGDISSGTLRVPRFQRPFVWRPEQMRSLFDSIERGYPIGSLLVWETTEEVPSLDRIADIEIPPAPSSRAVAYLLDGHQRMSTLFGCLWRRPDGREPGPDQAWKWRIYRVLGWPDGDRFQHWKRPGELTDPPTHHLPLSAILRTMDFLAFSRRLEADVADPTALIEEAEEVAQRIKSTQIALVWLKGGDLRHTVEAFSRVNTTGQMMNPDQMVSALTYRGEGESLADRIESIREGLGPAGYGQITPITVFRSFLAVAGEEDVLATRWEALAERVRGQMEVSVDNTEQALGLAVRFLREKVRVPMARLVPYQSQVMLLAAFFHYCPEPSNRQLRELERWFWGTSWSGYFAGANTTDVRNALQDMKDFAEGDSDLPWEPQRARPFPDRFDLRSARVRAFILWELREFPKRLRSDGKEIDPVEALATSATEAYRHVVERGAPSRSHPANRLIFPTDFKVSVRRALLDLPAGTQTTVLASHGIPPSALDRLRDDDGEGFITERAAALIDKERRFMADLAIEPPTSTSGEAEIDTE